MTRRQKRATTNRKIEAAARYIATSPHKIILTQIMRHAPNDLVKVISNAALNALRGPVYINPSHKNLLRKKRRVISLLASKQISVAKKRQVVQKGRGIFALLPILLSTALSAFGSRFFSGNSND